MTTDSAHEEETTNGIDAEDFEDFSTAEVSLSLSRTKAAMECWAGLKDSDSIKRPLGDVPVFQVKRPRVT